MKKALISTILVTMSILSACTFNRTTSETPTIEEASISLEVSVPKAAAPTGDVTAFLVGEYYSSNNCTTCFDGRGTVRIFAQDGSSLQGTYSLKETSKKNATLIMDIGSGEQKYTYSLDSDNGNFTIHDSKGGSQSFVLKPY